MNTGYKAPTKSELLQAQIDFLRETLATALTELRELEVRICELEGRPK